MQRAAWVLVFVLAGLYGLLALHPIWDVDVFWHIRAGEWIWSHRALPHADIFSAVEPSRPWTTFQWLYELLCYGADALGGLAAVRWLHALVTAAGLAAAGGFFLRRYSAAAGAGALVLLAFLFADRLRVRPDVFNLLFVALFLPALWRETLRGRDVAVLALLAGLWANLHAGGALLAPVLLTGRLAGRFLDQLLPSPGVVRRPLRAVWRVVRLDLIALLAALGVMALMPGFVRGTWQAFTMLGPSEAFIPEWMSTFEMLFEHAGTVHEVVAGVLPLAGLAWLLVDSALRLRRRDPAPVAVWRDLGYAVPLCFLALFHVRFVWLGAMPWWLLLARFPPRLPQWRRVTAVGVAALVLLALDVRYHLYYHRDGVGPYLASLGEDVEPGEFPVEAADFLREAEATGGILNHAAWGGYLLYRLWPACTVFTDGRGNFGALEAALLSALEPAATRGEAIRAASAQVDFAWVVHPAPFPRLAVDCHRWVRVYHDAVGQVWLHRGPATAANEARVAAALAARGGTDPQARGCALHGAATRYWGAQRVAAGERGGEIAKLQARVAAGEAEARLRLAAVYLELGHTGGVWDVLPGEMARPSGEDGRLDFLRAAAALAQGDTGRFEAVCRAAHGAVYGTQDRGAAILMRLCAERITD